MKSYTNLEQSKKLAEILPIDSADMCWCNNSIKGVSYTDEFSANLRTVKEVKDIFDSTFNEWDKYWKLIPCWSLAALLNILDNRAYSIDEDAIVTLSSYKTVEWDLSISNSGLYMITKSDPIDACVEMIVKLKEKDLI